MNNDFIKLSNKIFYFTNRQRIIQKIGSSFDRTINATGFKDIVATKYKWMLKMDLDNKELLRLESIFNLNASFSFVDYDGVNYTVLFRDNELKIDEISDSCFTVEFTLEQV